MTLYLCGAAALDVMRYVRSTNEGLIPGRIPRPRRLRGALHTNRELNDLNHSAQLMLSHVRGKVEALVPDHSHVTRTKRLETHLWSGDLPSGAFIDLGNGIYLSSPHFLFLQLATTMSWIDLVKLGNELCGFYSCWKLSSPYAPDSKSSGHNGTTYGILPVTTTQKLETYLRRKKNLRGSVAAREAARWVLNNAASPAETAIFLLLCLPRHRGGYGLPRPMFNVKVGVTTSLTHEVRYPDLYWAARGLDVEYQSDYAHTGEWKRYRDSQREVELEAEKVTVLPLTRLQLMDAANFDAFATSVRRILGRRTRPLPEDWWSRYLNLRGQLLLDA